MTPELIIILVVSAVVVILALYVIGTYNGLVKARNRVRDQWAQIEVVLKRRADLIPNVVETVKGYAAHEKETLDAVVMARNKAISATTPQAEMEASGEVTKALSKIMALSEAYPDLKANTNFLELQKELSETENKITYSRQFYNDSVLSYRNKIEVFPSNIVASMFKFRQSDAVFFEADEKSKGVPQVKF